MAKSTTPTIFKRYRDIKAEDPDSLLLIRTGDFYEAFGDDATTIADTIGLTIPTYDVGRGKSGVLMCGFPYHALEGYIKKLIAAGHRVAIGEAGKPYVGNVWGDAGTSGLAIFKQIVCPTDAPQAVEIQEPFSHKQRCDLALAVYHRIKARAESLYHGSTGGHTTLLLSKIIEGIPGGFVYHEPLDDEEQEFFNLLEDAFPIDHPVYQFITVIKEAPEENETP